jgi:tryptophanyl-tRNA synthetase
MSDAAKHPLMAFSGIQPSGKLHLGNYLGAMKNWVALQDRMPCIYCVVDMHAITVWQEPADLMKRHARSDRRLHCGGIDPKRSILFNQSRVVAHAELAWVFNCVARLGWVDRMTQFKEKSGKHKGALVGRALHLSGAAGGRHSRLQGDACAGRRGSAPASRAGTRHRAEVQQ